MELLPDSKLAAEVEAKEKDRLAQAKAQMSPEQIQAVIKETQELKLRQVIYDTLCSPPLSLFVLTCVSNLKGRNRYDQRSVVMPTDR